MIYQLLKTTPYLSGQVRLDMVADRLGGDSSLLLDEIHVVPLTDRIYYSGRENQLNNRHSDNVAELYRSIQDRFYACLGDQLLEGGYPYYNSTSTPIDTVDHTYHSGLRRLPKGKYSKEFSYLLPMWIDSPEDIDSIEFLVHVDNCMSGGDLSELTVRKFTLSKRLRNYLKEYLSGASTDLMYLGLRNHSAWITGLEVSSGTVLTKDISSVIPNLTDREKPLMEVDNLLVRQFIENKMIARQLINFNFCFSPSDLFTSVVEPTLKWNQLNIWVEAKLRTANGYRDIPLKDIYTNYTDIYSYKISNNPLEPGKFVENYTDSEGIKKFNVLDYLKDDKCLALMSKNRMLQPNFHWAFVDNLRYTWNLYNGFSPLVDDNGVISRIEGRFFSTPDVTSEEYSIQSNNIQWITVLDGTGEMFPGSFVGLTMSSGNSTKFSPNSFGTCWSKGIKYDLGSILEDGISEDGTSVESNGICANLTVIRDTVNDHLSSSKIYAAVLRREDPDKVTRDYISIVYVLPLDVDITSYRHLNQMTLLGLRRLLSGNIANASPQERSDVFQLVHLDPSKGEFCNLFVLLEDDLDTLEDADPSESKLVLKLFHKVLENVEYPNIVRFQHSLSTGLAPAPSIDHLVENGSMEVQYTDEIQYYKMDQNYSTYLMRYDGNIMPQFIDPELPASTEEDYWSTVDSGAFNKVYRKRQFYELTNNEVDSLNYLARQKFSPEYPSIGFYYLESSPVKLDSPLLPDNYLGEVTWIRKNKFYYTDPEFSLETICTAGEMTQQKAFDMFKTYVATRGMFSNMEPDEAEEIISDYLWPKYQWHSDWEYLSPTDIRNYRFTVTYTLR